MTMAKSKTKYAAIRNPAGTKLIKRFVKASKAEYPHYLDNLFAIAPKDRLCARFKAIN
jgi:hypothetical protein